MYKKIPQYFSVVVLAFILSLGVYTALAQTTFKSPTVAPPGGNVDAPLTTGTTAQTKGNATFDGDPSGLPVIFGNNAAIGARNTSQANQTFLFGRDGNNDTSLYFGSGGDFYIRDVSGNTKMTVEADGTVGINATNPDAALQVAGGNDCKLNTNSGYIVTRDGSSTNICLDNNEIQARDDGSHATLYLNADGGAVRVHNNVGGAARFTIESSGNVGIGTYDPGARLTVINDSVNTGNIPIEIGNSNTGSGTTRSAWIKYLGTTSGSGGDETWAVGNSGNEFTFSFIDSRQVIPDNGARYLVIKNNTGNVGINDTSPSEKLEVGGNIKASGTICDGNGCIGGAVATAGGWTDAGSVVRLATAGDSVGIGTNNPSEKLEIYGGAARIEFEGTASPSRRWMIGTDNSPSGLYLAYDRTANTSRIFVNTSGNVGINDTSPSYTLDVAGSIRSTSNIRTTNGSDFAYLATSDGGNYSEIRFGDDRSTDRFRIYADNCCGGGNVEVASFMANGNVGVGITNPGFPLDVAGDIRATGSLIANGNLDVRGLIGGTGHITVARDITAGGLVTANAFNFGNNSGMSNNQGGAIELGQSNTSGQTPFIDFHYGTSNSSGRDYTARIIADGSGQLTFVSFGYRFLNGSMEIRTNSVQYSQRLCHSGSNTTSQQVLLGDCGSSQADLAELYGVDDDTIEAGDVVSFLDRPSDGVKFYVEKSSSSYQENVMGVISTDPYDVMGEVFDEDEQKMPVALTGRVPVKVTTQNGVIKAGDRLTASSLAGHAMRATEAGTVLGMALESFNGDTGTVMLFVDIGYWAPSGR